MNPKPIVTLLIANYNYAHYIESAVQSAINQDYDGPIQVCVINDGSTDDSWSVLRSMCRADDAPIITQNISENRTLIAINRENGGASIARNTGIDYTWDSTDIYGILNADDYYYEPKVRKCVDKLIENQPHVGVVYADYDITYTESNTVVREYKPPYNRMALMNQCMIHSGALITKEALDFVRDEKGQIFDPDLHGPGSQSFIGCSEDYDLWIRISEKFMIFHIPESLAMMRETGSNQTTNVTVESHQRTQSIIMEKMKRRAAGV